MQISDGKPPFDQPYSALRREGFEQLHDFFSLRLSMNTWFFFASQLSSERTLSNGFFKAFVQCRISLIVSVLPTPVLPMPKRVE